MTPEEYAKLQKVLTTQFELALAGERPVFCKGCSRPFRARETTQYGDFFRSVAPYRHAVPAGRELCPGSEEHATLNPVHEER